MDIFLPHTLFTVFINSTFFRFRCPGLSSYVPEEEEEEDVDETEEEKEYRRNHPLLGSFVSEQEEE